MNKWILPLGLALLITACATPPTPSAQTVSATAPAGQSQMVVLRGTQPSGQKLICTETYPMGSHIPQRICLTQEQQAARQKASQEAMQNMQRSVCMQGACAGNGGSGPPR